MCGDAEEGPGNCESSAHGSLGPLPPHIVDAPTIKQQRWAAAATICLSRCLACKRCRVVSISIRFSDCFWYSSCEQLTGTSHSFRSAPLQALDVTGPWRTPPSRISPAPGLEPANASGNQASNDLLDTLDPQDAPPRRRRMHQHRGVKRNNTSILLLGVLSGSARRRAVVRCTWAAALYRLGGDVRLVFAVGTRGGKPPSDGGEADTLVLPVEEQMRPGWKGSSARWSLSEGGGSLSTYRKQVLFFRYAAVAPEPLVGKADDDVYVSPHLLIEHARLLHRMLPTHPHLHMGAFEWYSWRRSSLVATGWERTRRHAFFKAQDRNCSPSGRGWEWRGFDYGEIASSRQGEAMSREGCVGPFAFAKGPFYFLSRAAIRWLLASRSFQEDFARADNRHLVIANVPQSNSHLLDDALPEQLFEDVQMGFWLASHPRLHILRLKQYAAWCDLWMHVGDLHALLVAHRVPWDQYVWLDTHMGRLWASGSHVTTRVRCGGQPCSSHECAHVAGQRACAVEIKLAPGTIQPTMGCNKCKCQAQYPGSSTVFESGGTCNRDYWAGEPKLPRHCRRAA